MAVATPMGNLFPQYPREPAADDRLASFVAGWRAIGESTEPADRDRAEVAITAIYAEQRNRPPRFLWVPSPAAGLLAATITGIGPGSVPVPGIRPDAAWRRRVAGRLGSVLGLPDEGASSDLASIARRVGLGRSAGVSAVLRTVLEHVPDHGAWDEVPWAAALGAIGSDGRREAERRIGRAPGPLDIALLTTAIEGVVAEIVATQLNQAWERGIGHVVRRMLDGQFDVDSAMVFMLLEVFGVSPWWTASDRGVRLAALARRLDVARSAGPWWARNRIAIVSERPLTMRFDDEGRLHAEDGPALAYSDGFEVWAWHGVAVDRKVITAPAHLTIADIDAAWNAEARRVMIDRFGGVARFLSASQATLVHEDATGRLWHRHAAQGSSFARGPLIAAVEVRNSTPEPDGSYRTYLLRVPPDIRTAREAVAWTFGMSGAEYAPAAET